jgi:hypothetical protein
MSRSSLLAALLAALLVASASAPPASAEETKKKTRTIEREHFKLEVPNGWTDLPDVANEASNSLLGASTDLTGGAIAYGDRSSGVMVLAFWVKTKDKVSGVRAAVEAYHDEMKLSLEEGGTKVSRHETSETVTRLSSSFDAVDGEISLSGASVAAVGKDGKLMAWTAQCMYAAPKAKSTCDQIIGAFQVTIADKDLKTLEKKKK